MAENYNQNIVIISLAFVSLLCDLKMGWSVRVFTHFSGKRYISLLLCKITPLLLDFSAVTYKLIDCIVASCYTSNIIQ